MFEAFDHTADVGLRIRAESLDGLFADAGRALFSLIVANPAAVRSVEQRDIQLAGGRHDELLFDWLNELLYLQSAQGLLLGEFQVHVDDIGLQGRVAGEPLDSQRHELDHEVKAITYHDLKVEQTADGWLAEVIVDI